jgi:hypothetical protein
LIVGFANLGSPTVVEGSFAQGSMQKFIKFMVRECLGLAFGLVVVTEPLASLLAGEFVAESLFALNEVSFAAFRLDLDKVRLAVEEYALEAHFVSSNPEHLLV